MPEIRTHIDEGGRIVVPAVFRKALGLAPGDEVVLSLVDDGIRITTMQQAVRQAQALVRQYVPEGRSLSAELIEERRREAARE